jgi:hypothetical protein
MGACSLPVKPLQPYWILPLRLTVRADFYQFIFMMCRVGAPLTAML